MTDALEIWGGVECSLVRIRGTVRNQLEDTGHLVRLDDLDLIAGLGIRTLRYPVLWEMVERKAGSYDWSWADARLQRINELGMRPIAGLLHHGSGPSWTQILDPNFPDMLARYGALVAQRYPWIELYTPINEPLTTARISGLYGHWHPHGTSEGICLQLTVAQCRAIAMTMKAIRRYVPQAGLVQTEDFGRVFSTQRLAYQAEHETERRWLSLDLLAGRVDRQHRFYKRLLDAGIVADHLSELVAEPCVPDMIGIDYYLTSDRMIDERVDQFPDEMVGGNGIDSYVDIAAARSNARDDTSLRLRLDELWDRYHLPIAITELHNGSTRDEQIRWLVEGCKAAQAAKDSGVDVRAVTAWSLFGAVDWNSMLVRQDGFYESGAFDIRAGAPRPTALAAAIAGFAKHGSVDHPVLDRPGWWRAERNSESGGRPLLLVGFGRMISIIEQCCTNRRLTVSAARPDKIQLLVAKHQAWAAIEVDGGELRRAGSPAVATRMLCRFPDGGELLLQCDPTHPSIEVANALLDLVIDGQRGAFQLLQTGPGNQYELLPLPAEAPSGQKFPTSKVA
ncbi:family 1 glycosylhydrolase [Mesorhizobium sp. IMUNJ 23033]|uniref:family 1 glycosylhydrolase n=1 Tax=Mesorhizobium sp. IMUNJ 23033 TaxID=3378039 RepID=UPI00384D0F16